MKVILTQDIRGKGKRGQMIEVSDGYARNYLFPKKLAQEANADNLNTMRMNDKAKQEREAKERAEAMEISKRMKGFTVTVTAKGGGAGRLFGSVTNTEIAEALAAQQKITLDKRKIVVLGAGPIRIGQGVEFDYSTVHAVQTIRKAGYRFAADGAAA